MPNDTQIVQFALTFYLAPYRFFLPYFSTTHPCALM
jgi:hypothetical protein